MKLFGKTIAAILILFFGVIYSGYAFSVIWSWFIVPVFSLPELSVPVAIGIIMTISYTTMSSATEISKDLRENWFLYQGIVSIGKPSTALFFGWIVTFFL